MRFQTTAATVLIATFELNAVHAFQAASDRCVGSGEGTAWSARTPSSVTTMTMVASPINRNEEEGSDLSSLVSGMLQSHRENMDTEELFKTSSSTTNRSNDIIPQVSADGIYRIYTKEQYE